MIKIGPEAFLVNVNKLFLKFRYVFLGFDACSVAPPTW